MSEFWLFMATATSAMLIPGPDTLIVLRTALGAGVAAGTWAAAGSSVGNLVWGSVSVLGGSGVLAASPAAFGALRVAGAGYLALLGVQALRSTTDASDGLSQRPDRPPHLARRSAFRRGLATDLLNVKVGLFWTALVPQFLKAGMPPVLPAAMVAAMGALVFAWLTAYAWLAARVLATLAGGAFGRALNAVAGIAFLIIAVLLIASP